MTKLGTIEIEGEAAGLLESGKVPSVVVRDKQFGWAVTVSATPDLLLFFFAFTENAWCTRARIR